MFLESSQIPLYSLRNFPKGGHFSEKFRSSENFVSPDNIGQKVANRRHSLRQAFKTFKASVRRSCQNVDSD